jgi:hypothetical protein
LNLLPATQYMTFVDFLVFTDAAALKDKEAVFGLKQPL